MISSSGEVVSGFRGAALNQSRSASGVYTGLLCWLTMLAYYAGTDEDVSEVLHVAGEKRLHRCVSRICDTGYIPLPRSLTRYARSFDCGERKWLTNGAEISWKMPGRDLTGKRQGRGKAVFP